MAGPVVAAAVIFAPEKFIKGVHDSKQLPPEKREALFEPIRAGALAVGIGVAEVEEVDRINIFWATMSASRRAIAALGRTPEHVLVDGRDIPGLETSADPYRGRRPQELLYRGGVDNRQGDARPHDGRIRRALPRLRTGATQGILHGRAYRGSAAPGPLADSSPLVLAGRDGGADETAARGLTRFARQSIALRAWSVLATHPCRTRKKTLRARRSALC